MIDDEARTATAEAVRAAVDLSAHLERLAQRLWSLLPVEPEALAGWDDDRWERLHAFLRMFEQLYDLASRKLFRGLLALSGETIAGVSAQNQFRRVEAIGGIADAERWMAIGATRDMLVHDDPTDRVARAQRAKWAWEDLPDLIAHTRQVIAQRKTDGLVL